MKKRGQSNVITIVLIILLSLVAVIILWNVVYGTVIKSSKQVNTNIFDNTFDIKETKIYLNGTIRVSVKRISGNDSIDSLKFLFYNKNGETTSVERKNIPSQLETYNYDFSSQDIKTNIDSISVVPIIGKNAGLEAKEPIDLIKRDSNGNRVLDIPEGLVSWWKFDGDMKDSVGENDGKCSGDVCPVFTTDKKENENSAVEFDGVTNSIKIINSETISFDKNNNYAIATWISISGHNSVVDTIIEKWPGAPAYPYVMRIVPSYEKLLCAVYAGDPSLNYFTGYSKTKFTPNSGWHFVLCNFDHINKNLSLWIDGNCENSMVYSHFLPSQNIKNNDDLYFGSRSTNFYFKGYMDDVMIFNRALNSEEINGIYNMQK